MNTQASLTSATSAFELTSATLILNVKGMHCANCVQAVEKQLLQQTGVISAKVNLAIVSGIDYAGASRQSFSVS